MKSLPFGILQKFSSIPVADAHCDIPCKIYDPIIAQIGALSVVRLLDIMIEVTNSEKVSFSLTTENTMSRCIFRKEEEAERVKKEIGVIWGDYFKSSQFEAFPELNDLVHKIMQKASACKQDIRREHGEDLVNLVNRFAEIFWQSKDVKTIVRSCPYPPNLPIIYPV